MILALLKYMLLVIVAGSLLVVSISLVAAAILLIIFAVIGCIKGIVAIKDRITSANTGSNEGPH